MPKVTVTALPRQVFKGFGAIKRYFVSGEPETIDVTDAELAELQADPACYFLKVEDASIPVPAGASGDLPAASKKK